MSISIPYGRQDITAADIQAIVDTLNSDFITQGPAIDRFERAVADYCGVPYAVAVSSATAALHIACMALGLQAGQRLWTSPNTFVASANCGRYCGASVDFVDIDPQTYNMSVDALRDKLVKAEQTGTLPDVVVPVHFAGQSCDMQAIDDLSERYGFKVIEDASHAIGGQYRGQFVGHGAYADMTVFSFHPVKIITTGEGGMVLTRDRALYQRLVRLRTHGITRDEAQMQHRADGPWYYEQLELGFNYRMTDIQAALGTSQMQRLDNYVDKRLALAERYNHLLKELPLTLPWQHPDTQSAWHLYVIRLHDETCRHAVFQQLRSAGIGVNVHYMPVHLQPYYRALGFKPGDYPEAEQYYRQALSLPLYPTLTEAQQDFVVESLETALKPLMQVI